LCKLFIYVVHGKLDLFFPFISYEDLSSIIVAWNHFCKFYSSILNIEVNLVNYSLNLYAFISIFLNRCREKQRKEASRLQTVNRKLTAMNKLLMEENDRLQKQVSHLVYENGYMKQQLHSVSF
jgi:N-glycosylase/DNA lyase